MIKLSDAQLVILTTACQRPDGYAFPITLKLKGNAIGNVLKSLVSKGLLAEVPGRADDTLWRYQDGAPHTLKATRAAYDALGIDEGTTGDQDAGGDADTADTVAAAGADAGEGAGTAPQDDAAAPPAAPAAARQRADSKQARLIAMLQRDDGATVAEIAAAFGWQPHTVRGAIAGALKKRLGLSVTSAKVEGRGRVYRLPA